MRRFALLAAATVAAATVAEGCHHGGAPEAGPQLSVADVTARLDAARAARTGFLGESLMDYWLGKQRVKSTVYVMGQTGAKVRFNGLSPAGGDVLMDLACDGSGFKLLDKQNNCQLTGPCDRGSIAELMHVELDPDDFLHLALGTPPILPGATGTVTWDAARGVQRVTLTAPGGAQQLAIDTRDGHFDVVSSELDGPDGKPVWSVDNSDFHDVPDDASHGQQRVPGKSRFKSPRQDADVLVEWKQLKVNPALEPAKFDLQLPAGLPECHGPAAAP